jgi:hypothetical protein
MYKNRKTIIGHEKVEIKGVLDELEVYKNIILILNSSYQK